MEVKINKNVIVIKHNLKSNETYKLINGSKYKSITIFNRPQIVGGFSNSTGDNKAVLTIDYDGVGENIIQEDYSFIQGLYALPQAYLFKTSAGYHVICLKKFLNSEIAEILRQTRCDENYKSMPLRNHYRSWILRISNKVGKGRPKFIKLIGAPGINLEDEISTAHRNLLTKLYRNIKHPQYLKEDGLKKVKLQQYETTV